MVKKREIGLIKSISTEVLENHFYGLNDEGKIRFINDCHAKIKKLHGILHLTPNINEIKCQRIFYTSAGGLGGCLYGVPIFFDNSIHNLGMYIYEKEMPMFLANDISSNKILPIIAIPKIKRVGLVDYLSFGRTYYSIYQNSTYLQSKVLCADMDRILETEKHYIDSIVLSLEKLKDYKNIDHCLRQSRVLKVLFFEVATEYLFLFQCNDKASKCSDIDELYNKNVKDLVYRLNRSMQKRFSLQNFNSGFQDIYKYITKSDSFDYRLFHENVSRRLLYFINHYLINDYENLKGHVLFRYFYEREYLEEQFAIKLWSEANMKNVNILSYYLPKGEIGLLPSPIDDPAFHEGSLLGHRVVATNKLSLKMNVCGVNKSKFSIMRNPYLEVK